MRINVRIDAAQTLAELQEAKRQIRAKTKEGLVEAGRIAVLPRVRSHAPGFLEGFLTIKATTARGYVTTAGPKKFDRIAGLLNFGGAVKTVIRPKEKQALRFRDTNIIVAEVAKPRRYKGKHFIEKGLEEAIPELERQMLPTLMESYKGLPHSP